MQRLAVIEVQLCLHYLTAYELAQFSCVSHSLHRIVELPLSWQFASSWRRHYGPTNVSDTTSSLRLYRAVCHANSQRLATTATTEMREGKDSYGMPLLVPHIPQRVVRMNQDNSSVSSPSPSPIICDLGSSQLRIGFSNINNHTHLSECITHRSMIGRWRNPAMLAMMHPNMPPEGYVGNDVWRYKGILMNSEPILNGIFVKTDDIAHVLKFLIRKELKVDTEENPMQHPILIAESLFNPANNRATLIHALFNEFHAPAVAIVPDVLLSFYAALAGGGSSSNNTSNNTEGSTSLTSTTGLVVSIGEHQTTLVPIVNGTPLRSHQQQLPYGGQTPTFILSNFVQRCGFYMANRNDVESVRRVKERCGFVEQDTWKKEEKDIDSRDPALKNIYVSYETSESHSHEISSSPPNTLITYKTSEFEVLLPRHELSYCNEIFFQTHLMREVMKEMTSGLGLVTPKQDISQSLSLQQTIVEMIVKCPADVQDELWKNIVLTGGAAQTLGLRERLEKEVKGLAPPSIAASVRIITSPTATGSSSGAWFGGSILANMDAFRSDWITREEYQKHGETAFVRKGY